MLTAAAPAAANASVRNLIRLFMIAVPLFTARLRPRGWALGHGSAAILLPFNIFGDQKRRTLYLSSRGRVDRQKK
jgi:hypothetical protein